MQRNKSPVVDSNVESSSPEQQCNTNSTSTQVNIIDKGEDKSSVIVEFYGKRYRALVDTGASVSLIHRRITEHFPQNECPKSTQIKLRAATGDSIKVIGEMDLRFKLGKKYLNHTFIVADNIGKNVILGRDCLKEHEMKVDFGKNQLILPGQNVPLQNDIYMTSLVRVANKQVLLPQTSTIVWCKLNNQRPVNKDKEYCICAIETGFVNQEPGLMVSNSVSKIGRKRKFPVLICNNTNKRMKLNRGNVVAKIEDIEGDCVPLTEAIHSSTLEGDKQSLDLTSIPEEHREQLEKLLEKNSDLFAATDLELGRTEAITMKIDTGDHPPIRLKPYRTPINQREVVDKAINEMLEAKVIRRSTSSWSFPTLMVPKKDGGKRFCVDFRKLNAITRQYQWPLPHLDDIMVSFGKSRVFSSLDLKSGYWQVPMDEKDREKTAFVSHRGLFEFNCMPFGLTNAPSVFQELMTHVLDGINHFATAYLDDIVIYSPSVDEHLKHLSEVFDRLRTFGLKMKMSKCKFMEKQIKYLGFVVGENGIEVDPDKVRVIREMVPPTDVRGVRAFIGCVSYYRRFCPKFSEIATPLIKLTKKHAKFEWTDQCQVSFQRLKDLLAEAPTLIHADPTREYVLYTDSSDGCVGAVLCQNLGQGEQPVHYLSHKLSESQRKWPILEKEAYAIYYALQKLDHLLHGSVFTIRTDHKPLRYLFSSEMKNRKVQMWAIAISSYNCKIEYIKGKNNEQADMLSRLPHEECADKDQPKEVDVINSSRVAAKHLDSGKPTPDTVSVNKLELPDMVQEQKNDPELKKLRKTLESAVTSDSVKRRYALVDDLLYYLGHDNEEEPSMKLMIPEKYKEEVLNQYHDDCAHWSVEKTYTLIRQNYHWQGLHKAVVEYVNKCITCKVRSLKQNKVPLQKMDEVEYPGQKWSLDLVGPYPESVNGNKYALTAVDHYSSWAECWPIPNKRTENVVRIVIDELIPRFSVPEMILTDNGTEFTSHVFNDLCHELNITHVTTSPYHPRANSKVERFHRVLHDMLSKKTSRHLEMWDQYIPGVLQAYRIGINESTSFSPYFLMYTRDPVLPLDNILRPRRKYLGDDYHKVALERQHEAFMRVRRNLRKAKTRQKKYHDRNAKEIEYEIGDPVFYRNNTKESKLDDRWKSHYRVIEINSPVTCTIRNQLTGDVRKVNIEHLVKADLTDWPDIESRSGRRKATLVVPPKESDDEYKTAESEAYTDEDDIPLAKLRKRWYSNDDE